MIGSSSTWYAMSARLRSSRSSAARAAGSDDGKQLLRRVDDRVRLLELEPRAVVDTAPRDGDRPHPRRLRGADVEGRVADIRRLLRPRAKALGGEEQGLGVGLVPLGLVAADDRVEHMPERNVLEGELDGGAALRGDEAEAAALRPQLFEGVLHAGAGEQLLMQRLVVCPIDGDELVHSLR